MVVARRYAAASVNVTLGRRCGFRQKEVSPALIFLDINELSIMPIKHFFLLIFLLIFFSACQKEPQRAPIAPTLRTEPVEFDTDDPAIWYNADDPAASLILGTDKEVGGGLYVFDLQGRIQYDKVISNLAYPNNVDVEYGFPLNDSTLVDLAITVERPKGLIRIFSVPAMQPLDGGGIPAFATETDTALQRPMGVAIYKRAADNQFFLMLSRKQGPTDGNYLWQYAIRPDSNGVRLEQVRAFGQFSGGESEIEAIMVDDALGYVYYSDELKGIRKYYADPEKGNEELALFGEDDFKEDREGISLWPTGDSTGYIIVSNQQDNSFNVYPRHPANHQHELITRWYLSTVESDGNELLARPLGEQFPNGVFVAMSEDTTFHYYALDSLTIKE